VARQCQWACVWAVVALAAGPGALHTPRGRRRAATTLTTQERGVVNNQVIKSPHRNDPVRCLSRLNSRERKTQDHKTAPVRFTDYYRLPRVPYSVLRFTRGTAFFIMPLLAYYNVYSRKPIPQPQPSPMSAWRVSWCRVTYVRRVPRRDSINIYSRDWHDTLDSTVGKAYSGAWFTPEAHSFAYHLIACSLRPAPCREQHCASRRNNINRDTQQLGTRARRPDALQTPIQTTLKSRNANGPKQEA
jgi:hypothetical protein